MPLDDFYNKIVALQEFDVLQESIDIINKNAYYISGLLRLQLQKGKDGRGDNVTLFGRDFYTDATVFGKERHGQGFGKFTEWITNYMTGEFYNSLKVRTVGETFESYSDVPYFEDIIKRSGSIIMELDLEHLEDFKQEILIPQLQERFNLIFNGV